MSGVWAIIPVKRLAQAKSRLSPILGDEDRAELSRQMLLRTLAVLAECSAVAQRLVISADPEMLDLARQAGGQGMVERWPSGEAEDRPEAHLNAALTQASELAIHSGAEAILVLPADLGLIETTDVEAILSMAGDGPAAVLAPDWRQEGTNALFVRPAGAIPYMFGPGSFQAHRAAAATVGLPVRVYQSARTSLDLDRPEDLRRRGVALTTGVSV